MQIKRVRACLLNQCNFIMSYNIVATLAVCMHADCVKILRSALLWHNALRLIESYHHYIP